MSFSYPYPLLLCKNNGKLHRFFSFLNQPFSSAVQNYVNAKNFLEKRYQDDMELEDAIHTALLTLREGFEGEMTARNIEVGIVSTKDRVFRLLTPEQVQDYLDEAT